MCWRWMPRSSELAAIDQRQSRLVELRFFGGLTGEEIATVLGVAPITVKRDWALAESVAVPRAARRRRDDHARELGADSRAVPDRAGALAGRACRVPPRSERRRRRLREVASLLAAHDDAAGFWTTAAPVSDVAVNDGTASVREPGAWSAAWALRDRRARGRWRHGRGLRARDTQARSPRRDQGALA